MTAPLRIVPILTPKERAGTALRAPLVPPTVQLTYHKGNLLTSVQVVTIFWGAAWNQQPQSGLIPQLNAFFDFILTSSLIDLLVEYSVAGQVIGYGSRIGTQTITNSQPGGATGTVSDAQIQQALQGWINNGTVAQVTANTLYFVYLSPGVIVTNSKGQSSCTFPGICGYHDDINGTIFYAVVPYLPCTGCTSGSTQPLDSFTKVSSHELCEAITDPASGGWWDGNNGQEIGDICNNSITQLGGFTIQSEWSNQANACTTSLSMIVKSGKYLKVGRNLDGRLEVFYIGTDDVLYHTWQKPKGGWSDENTLGSAMNKGKALAVGTNADGRLEVFYIGTDDVLYHMWQRPKGGWSDEGPVGTSTNKGKALEVGRNADGRLEVFYIGTDDVLYHMWQKPKGGWNDEGPVGTSTNKGKALAVGTNADGRLEVFYIGTDDVLYHMWQKPYIDGGGWSDENTLSSDTDHAEALAVATTADGRLEVFNIKTNNHLIHNWQKPYIDGGGWSGEHLLF